MVVNMTNTSLHERNLGLINELIREKDMLITSERYVFMRRQVEMLSHEHLNELLLEVLFTSLVNQRTISSHSLVSDLTNEEITYVTSASWLLADITHGLPRYIKYFSSDAEQDLITETSTINDIIEYAALLELLKHNVIGVFEPLRWGLITEIFDIYLPKLN